MAGCPYCGGMHPPLRVCDEMRRALAHRKGRGPDTGNTETVAVTGDVDNKPHEAVNVDNRRDEQESSAGDMDNGKPAYRYRDPEARRVYMRDLMRRRRAEGKA